MHPLQAVAQYISHKPQSSLDTVDTWWKGVFSPIRFRFLTPIVWIFAGFTWQPQGASYALSHPQRLHLRWFAEDLAAEEPRGCRPVEQQNLGPHSEVARRADIRYHDHRHPCALAESIHGSHSRRALQHQRPDQPLHCQHPGHGHSTRDRQLPNPAGPVSGEQQAHGIVTSRNGEAPEPGNARPGKWHRKLQQADWPPSSCAWWPPIARLRHRQ